MANAREYSGLGYSRQQGFNLRDCAEIMPDRQQGHKEILQNYVGNKGGKKPVQQGGGALIPEKDVPQLILYQRESGEGSIEVRRRARCRGVGEVPYILTVAYGEAGWDSWEEEGTPQIA